MPACEFTYSHYEEILECIKNSEYVTSFFNDAFSKDKELILRHDIDQCLESAYRIALLEEKYYVKSTYFICLRSPFYNIFERSNSDLIDRILGLGHQIGLHFNEACYDISCKEDILKFVDGEVKVLTDFLKTGIYTVSFHRPSKFLLESDIQLNNNMINTYGKKFIENFKYISDSRRMWKDNCICKYLSHGNPDDNKYDRIQALLHPIWWTDANLNSQETLELFLKAKLKYLDHELCKSIQVYKSDFSK